MSLKNACMARREALEERKGGFVGADLAAWQADGRALFLSAPIVLYGPL